MRKHRKTGKILGFMSGATLAGALAVTVATDATPKAMSQPLHDAFFETLQFVSLPMGDSVIIADAKGVKVTRSGRSTLNASWADIGELVQQEVAYLQGDIPKTSFRKAGTLPKTAAPSRNAQFARGGGNPFAGSAISASTDNRGRSFVASARLPQSTAGRLSRGQQIAALDLPGNPKFALSPNGVVPVKSNSAGPGQPPVGTSFPNPGSPGTPNPGTSAPGMPDIGDDLRRLGIDTPTDEGPPTRIGSPTSPETQINSDIPTSGDLPTNGDENPNAQVEIDDVPAPAALPIIIAGLAALGWTARRRRFAIALSRVPPSVGPGLAY